MRDLEKQLQAPYNKHYVNLILLEASYFGQQNESTQNGWLFLKSLHKVWENKNKTKQQATN